MAKKISPLVWVAIAGAGGYIIWQMMKKRGSGMRSTVTADSPIRQTEDEFYQDRADVEQKPSPLETVTNIFKTVFPKKTAEEKAAKKTARLAKRTARKAKKQVSGVDQIVF
jgi:hypothetical protein